MYNKCGQQESSLTSIYLYFRAFLSIALGLLDECYRTNEDLAQQLLTYNLDNWGDQCCLSIAVGSRHEEFVAHACCQTLLTKVWMGALKVGKWASLGVSVVKFVPRRSINFVYRDVH